MVANCSAHKIRLFIGSEDWSRQLVSIDVGQDLRSESGLLLLSGSIVLGATAGMPGSMNPRTSDGRSRWWRGQTISIEATDSNGVYVNHRFGHLYLLKVPSPPIDGQITLEVGCILNLRSFVQPDDDASGVEYPSEGLPVSTDRLVIINRLLSAANCPNCIDAIPYPIQIAISKQGGSYVELAGKIAYAAGRYLYQDNLGRIRAVSANLSPKTPVVTITIGRDEISYLPYEGAETPSEIVKAVGVRVNLISNYGEQIGITEDYAPGATVDPQLGNTPILIRRSFIREITDRTGYKREEIVYAVGGIVSSVSFPNSVSLVLDKYEQTIKFYGGSAAQGALRRIATVTKRLFPAYAPDVWEALTPNRKDFWKLEPVSGYQDTYYTYTSDELLLEERVETREPIAAVVTDEDFDEFETSPDAVVFSGINRVVYERTTPRIGKRITTEMQVTARAFPNLDYGNADATERLFAKIALVTTKSQIETSTTGQLTPPAAERIAEPVTEEEEPLECEVVFSFSPFLPVNQERERVIQVDTPISDKQQLCELAQIRGLELIGYALGQTIQIPLYDVFLNDGDPLPQILAIDTDGTISRFSVTGIQISHDPNQAVVGFTGIWLGSADAENPTVFLPPYDSVTTSAPLVIPQPSIVIVPKVGGARSGGRVTVLPYQPQAYTYSFSGGARAGGRVTVIDGLLVTSESIAVTSNGEDVYTTS